MFYNSQRAVKNDDLQSKILENDENGILFRVVRSVNSL